MVTENTDLMVIQATYLFLRLSVMAVSYLEERDQFIHGVVCIEVKLKHRLHALSFPAKSALVDII
jgi:hypothetical protein